jgi:hypothetical protein
MKQVEKKHFRFSPLVFIFFLFFSESSWRMRQSQTRHALCRDPAKQSKEIKKNAQATNFIQLGYAAIVFIMVSK